ncbi:hypothetical protein HQN89_04795 [Paenibacillus frigoriresistens]|uniref:hypothetical protein n=1 Tax=Paenibacillus alginolyticus TaxID=59839 RepID=UPI00156472E7|nr:hypothetical protein [Paenibacillus frigoriresistens]NRF90352.1 hypothetical protein [Paenibacillus frigoriresistens]
MGIGVDHKYGIGALTHVTFDNIDIEKLSYTYNTNHIRTWASFAIRNGDSFGGGTIDNLNVKNINVRDKGTTPGRLKYD